MRREDAHVAVEAICDVLDGLEDYAAGMGYFVLIEMLLGFRARVDGWRD